MKNQLINRIKLFSPLLFIFMFFSAITFTSCENIFKSGEEKSSVSAYGKIKIVLEQPENNQINSNKHGNQNFFQTSRTVLPFIDINKLTSFKLTGINDESSKILGAWDRIDEMTSASVELPVGDWKLTLTAQNNGITFSDTQEVYIAFGAEHYVFFTLATDSGNGGIILNIGFSGSDVRSAAYRLFNYPGDTLVASGDISEHVSEGYVLFERNSETNPISAGTYRIEIKFYADSEKSILLNTYSEIIRVKGGFTSSAANYIDLNNLYHLYYQTNAFDTNGNEITAGELLKGGEKLLECYSVYSETISLPVLERAGYIFDGWYYDYSFSDGPHSEFKITPENLLEDKTFYAKWRKIFTLSYKVLNQAGYSVPLPEAQIGDWGLPASINEGEDLHLSAPDINNGEGKSVSFVEYKIDDSLNGFDYPASVITDGTIIYICVNPDCAYIDPEKGNDDYLAFNVNTPAKSVEVAKGWLKGANPNNNPCLYVKSTISDKDEIEQLTDLTKDVVSGHGEYGAWLARHSSLSNAPVIHLTSGSASLSELLIYGGAVWNQLNQGVYNLTNTGIHAAAPLVIVDEGAILNLESVQLYRNDNSAGAAFDISGTVNSNLLIVEQCKAENDGVISVKGTLSDTSGNFLYNYSTGNGGAVITGTESAVSITDAIFKGNYADGDGGAIYCQSKSNPLIFTKGKFEANNVAAGKHGENIYIKDKGYLKLTGDSLRIIDGFIYFDNTSSTDIKPLVIDPSFKVSGTLTIIPKYYYSTGSDGKKSFNKQLLNIDSLTDTDKSTLFNSLKLQNSTDYLIDNSGFIKPKPGYITVTPGFPENYDCKWTQTLSGSTRTINIIIKDADGTTLSTGTTAGSILPDSIEIDFYEDEDLIQSVNSLSFTFPSWWPEAPSGTPFYVKFNVKVDETIAYSYDYWPSEYLGG